jgi:hypothetical protein
MLPQLEERPTGRVYSGVGAIGSPIMSTWSCALVWSAIAIGGCKAREPTQAETKAKLEQKLAGAQAGEEREVDPGLFMTMFRTQATAPLPDGWNLAASTRGGFSVELPISFNDFRMRTQTEDHTEVRTDMIGGKTAGLLAWTALCATRADGKLSPSGPPPTNKTESLGTPVRAWQRTIVLEGRLCMLVVEAQGTDPLPAEADIQRFLHSFKQT